MSQPIKALQFRTKKYAWSLATVSWLLAIGNSSQAIIYRKSLHYIHNSTFIGRVKILISQKEKVERHRFNNVDDPLRKTNDFSNELKLSPMKFYN